MSINNIPQLPTPDPLHLGELGDIPTPDSWAHNSTTYTPIDSMTPITTNPSRKRSRDESAFVADGESSYFSFPSTQDVSTPAPIPEEEPEYGEGMVLINPSSGRPLTAESQTGTWYEEQEAKRKLEAEVAAEQSEKKYRPQMPIGRKSIRMSQSSIRADLDPLQIKGAPASPPKSSPDRPEVDEATLALGIGWTKMASEDPDLQAAARGWAKYIENHYRSIHNPELLLKSRSLNAYLIRCDEGYFLFGEDLLEGKMVGKSWEVCLQNLRTSPMTFEGDYVYRAERTPGAEGLFREREGMKDLTDHGFINRLPQVAVGSASGMDLD